MDGGEFPMRGTNMEEDCDQEGEVAKCMWNKYKASQHSSIDIAWLSSLSMKQDQNACKAIDMRISGQSLVVTYST